MRTATETTSWVRLVHAVVSGAQLSHCLLSPLLTKSKTGGAEDAGARYSQGHHCAPIAMAVSQDSGHSPASGDSRHRNTGTLLVGGGWGSRLGKQSGSHGPAALLLYVYTRRVKTHMHRKTRTARSGTTPSTAAGIVSVGRRYRCFPHTPEHLRLQEERGPHVPPRGQTGAHGAQGGNQTHEATQGMSPRV